MFSDETRTELVAEMTLLELSSDKVRRFRAIQALLMNEFYASEIQDIDALVKGQEKDMSEEMKKLMKELSSVIKELLRMQSSLFGAGSILRRNDETTKILCELVQEHKVSLLD